LQSVDEWLAPYRKFWNQRLDALATELARGKRARRQTTASPIPKGSERS
jgi:hypothetical protein